ncbi:MAG: D-glycerate dehydrogenase [Sphingomonadales bacterium]|nr:D-glycerate dehydrogenase [Sphingomonadales bacterium]MDE2568863.1 D-glycerate dehydrogenase [Sphingomonadales bacterium]
MTGPRPAHATDADLRPTRRIEGKPAVIVTRRLLPETERRMDELFNVSLNGTDAPMSRDQLVAAMRACDVLVPTVTDRIDAAMIEAAGDRLGLIANFGAGIEHIDLGAARARRIIVTNTPGVFTDDTADMTMALIISVPRRFVEGGRLMRAGEWKGWGPTAMLGHRIGGKVLGIIGMGRIGQAVAHRARAFGLSIAYHNRQRLPEAIEQMLGARYVTDLDTLCREADILTLHCPANPDTHHMINARRIALMKPDAYLVNTARGELIDEDALIAALQEGRIGGAGLDVYAQEPQVDPRFLSLGNATLLPHVGSATFEGREASGEKVIANIRFWSDGHRPPDQVLEGWA